MSDIFISYASPDRDHARQIAEVLENEGWSVWWDRSILPGQKYNKVIEEAINNAKCIVVLWSQSALASDWVRDEAEVGRQRGILIPVLLEDVQQPMGFRTVHFASMIDWDGVDKESITPLLTSLEAILGKAPKETNKLKTEKKPPPTAKPGSEESVIVEKQHFDGETNPEKIIAREESSQKSLKTPKKGLYAVGLLGVIIIVIGLYTSMRQPTHYVSPADPIQPKTNNTLPKDTIRTDEPTKLPNLKISPTPQPQTLSRQRFTAESFFSKADTELKEKNYSGAINFYKAGLNLDRENPDAWTNLGLSYSQLGNNDEAIKCFDRALSIDPQFKMALFHKNFTSFGKTLNTLKTDSTKSQGH